VDRDLAPPRVTIPAVSFFPIVTALWTPLNEEKASTNMRIQRMAVSCTLLLVFTTAAVEGSNSGGRVTWDEFSTRVSPKHTIRMVLPNGTIIQGQALHLKDDAIEMHVTRTSNAVMQQKGNAIIPRASVSVIDVRSPRRAGKIIGTLVPIAAGLALGAAGVAGNQGSESVYGYALVGGIIVAAAPVGYFVGRAIDRRFDRFTIIPAGQLPKPEAGL
jgi:hypothetical protein